MNLIEFFTKWHLSRQQLSEKMGMLKGTFHNKFSAKHPTKFTEEEIKEMVKLLDELRDDIKKVKKHYK